ncbi:MAG: hypothetical protein Q8L48_26265 [Archangium sp.]|nr:hypothetical protein [Archangium sp.]
MLRAFAVGLSLWFLACPPPTPVPPAVKQVSSVDATGLVLYVGALPGRTNFGFGLLDPRTGKTTATLREVLASGAAVIAAGSPDGRHLAWIDGGRTVHFAELGLDPDGVPTVTELAAVPVSDDRGLAFTNRGDTLVTTRDYVTFAPAPKATTCVGADGVLVTPAGDEWFVRCGQRSALFRGSEEVMPLGEVFPAALSVDGQFTLWNDPLLIPHRTLFLDPTRSDARLDGPFGFPEGMPEPDGTITLSSAGKNGKYVKEITVMFAQFTQVDESTAVPEPGLKHALGELFTSRRFDLPVPTPAASLDGLPEAEGRGWLPLGVLPDGSADVWSMIGWTIENDGIVYQRAKWGALQVRSRLDGLVQNHVGGELLGACAPREPGRPRVYGETPVGPFMLAPETWACAAGKSQGSKYVNAFDSQGTTGMRGVRSGAAVEWTTSPSLVTPDGRAFLHAATAGRGAGFCFTFVKSGATECLDVPALAGMMPMLLLGHAVEAPATGAASVLWVSHEAATPGTEVRVFGTRFGAAGTVELGGVAVPASDVLSWTDEQVRFRMPQGAPAFGRVVVSSAAGADLEARPFFLTKTAAQPSSLADAALDVSLDQAIAQGLTALPRPVAGRTYKLQDPRRFSTDSTPVLLENATLLLHATGRCAADTRLWTIDGLYATHRKATCRAQLDPTLAWTVVQSPATELAEPTLAGRLHHFSGELIVSGAQPSYAGLSWRWLQRVTNGELRCDATRSGTFQSRFADVRGFPAQGSMALLPDGTVLRVGDPVQEPGLHHTVALDWNSAWDLRNPSRTAIDSDLTSVAAAGTRVVLAGSTFADNDRARLRTSTNGGQTFPVETLGASSLAGTFAPIFTLPQGQRAGFVGAYSSGTPMTLQSLYRVAPDGTLTENAFPLPPGPPTSVLSLDFGVIGPRLFAWNRESKTLAVLDTNAAAPAWQSLAAGVTSFMVDEVRQRAFVAVGDQLSWTQPGSATLEPYPSQPVVPASLRPITVTLFGLDQGGFAHVGVAEWTGVFTAAPVRAMLIGRPVP